METILREVEKGLDSGFAYLALAVALTLPDICAALSSPNGDTGSKKYKNWYTANLAAKYPRMTADDCYNLRNGVVHQGTAAHSKMQYSRIIFTLPDAKGTFMHDNILNGALNLDTATFCKDVVEAVRAWFRANSADPNVVKNLPNLVQLRFNGFPPYIRGPIPVIA